MIIDGRTIAQEILTQVQDSVQSFSKAPRLAVFTCAPNFETQKFLAIKEKQASAVGIEIDLVTLPESVTLTEVAARVAAAVDTHEGIIIQFPFPHLATLDLMPLVPAFRDVDVLTYHGQLDTVLPPVVGAIDEISRRQLVTWDGAAVVVVGNGRLVGSPAAQYAQARGARVTVVTKDTADIVTPLQMADIIILGAGKPGLLTPEMIKEGVIIFDAGTSEEGGQLKGDADVTCAKKAAIFTPVPGGIGPITVAVLLRNLIELVGRQ